MRVRRCIKGAAIIAILLTSSCVFVTWTKSYRFTHERKKNYIEPVLSFYDNDTSLYKTWIRKPENIRIVHESLKKIGYKNILDDKGPYLDWHTGSFNVPYHLTFIEAIDSLCLTYPLDKITSTYFHKFWQRRKNEQNDEVVYETLKEILAILKDSSETNVNEALVNDTIYKLAKLELNEKYLNDESALENFNILKELGMHKSAVNLLYGAYEYEHIHWNRRALRKQLTTDTAGFRKAWVKGGWEGYPWGD